MFVFRTKSPSPKHSGVLVGWGVRRLRKSRSRSSSSSSSSSRQCCSWSEPHGENSDDQLCGLVVCKQRE
jgi:hypothetical protein